MSLPPFARRIDQLRHLRSRIDAEIAAEEARLGRIEQARRAAFPGQPGRPVLLPGERPDTSVVRAWAREHNVPVGERGPHQGRGLRRLRPSARLTFGFALPA